jgi:hypothetical protein
MRKVIDHATWESKVTCDVCAESGTLAERRGWQAARCLAPQNWISRPWRV